ncbi:MAG: hypothetical protein JWN39_2891, partial [Ilumatobacteraceae bacterium]|nr:hypothetical protein [Ilumatobacteraceae bacterium]
VLASRPAVDSTRLTFFDPVGGDVLIIDIGSSKLVSARDVVDDAAGEYASTRGFATAQAFTDVKSDPPHTLIVPNNGDDPWLVDGGVLDIDGNRSLAATFGSADSTVSIFDRDKQVDTASLDMAVIGGLLTGDHAATIVSADGKVSSVDMKGGMTKDITDLEVEPGFAIAMTHDRMFVAGHDDTSYLIDAAGTTVRSFDPAQDGDGNAEAVSFVANGYVPGARCFITQAGSGIVRGGKIDVRTVVDGKSVAQLSTTGVLAVTPDGCTAIGLSGDSADLVLDGKEKDLGRDATVTALSPDLRQAVISGGNGFQLVDIASGRTTDLDRGLYTYAVVAD